MYLKTKAFHHIQWLKKAVDSLQGEAFINASSYVAEIRFDNRVYVLYPMFTALHEGRKVYTYQFHPDTLNFAGWKPYIDRPIPELGKKLSFKRFVEKHSLLTPAYSTDTTSNLQNVIVKKDISSFGDTIQGPFRDTSVYKLDPEHGEYFECFTPGEIVKVWYWNETPIVMEFKDMPTITGDGRSSIRDLVLRAHEVRARDSQGEIKWAQVKTLLTYQGLEIDEVLPEGRSTLIDFRLISAFTNEKKQHTTVFKERHAWFDPLYKLGELINADLVDQGQVNTMYSVDAIRDADGNYWFLEVNFNPSVHPCLYPEIVSSLKASDNFREIRRLANN